MAEFPDNSDNKVINDLLERVKALNVVEKETLLKILNAKQQKPKSIKERRDIVLVDDTSDEEIAKAPENSTNVKKKKLLIVKKG
tara:strand:- start:22558 stop:22809 length:252 start_codon:yes stop_codon:yes gene_type:complete